MKDKNESNQHETQPKRADSGYLSDTFVSVSFKNSAFIFKPILTVKSFIQFSSVSLQLSAS